MKNKSEGVEQQQFWSKVVNCFLTYELVGLTILKCTQLSTDRRVCRVANSRFWYIKFGVHLKSWVWYPVQYQRSSMRLQMEQAMKDKSEGVEQQQFQSKVVNCFLTYELVGLTILRCTQRSTDRRVCCAANSRLQYIKFGVYLKSWVPSSSLGWQDTKVGTTLNWQENLLWR